MTITNTFGLLLSTLVATAAAQTPSPAPAQPAPQPGAMVTVEGCLTREPGPKDSTAALSYVLTDRTPPAAATGATTGTSTSSATAAGNPPPARKMYVLRPHSDAIDLAKHVNHIVRVTGATTAPQTTSPLAGRSPEATPNPAPTAPPGSTGTPFDTANLPTLAVTNLSMVAASCR
jgi:hypothetical protein